MWRRHCFKIIISSRLGIGNGQRIPGKDQVADLHGRYSDGLAEGNGITGRRHNSRAWLCTLYRYRILHTFGRSGFVYVMRTVVYPWGAIMEWNDNQSQRFGLLSFVNLVCKVK